MSFCCIIFFQGRQSKQDSIFPRTVLKSELILTLGPQNHDLSVCSGSPVFLSYHSVCTAQMFQGLIKCIPFFQAFLLKKKIPWSSCTLSLDTVFNNFYENSCLKLIRKWHPWLLTQTLNGNHIFYITKILAKNLLISQTLSLPGIIKNTSALFFYHASEVFSHMPNFSESILFIIIIQVGSQGKKLLGNIGFSLCFIIKIFLLTIQERRRKIRNRWTEYV